MPSTTIDAGLLTDGAISVIDLLVTTGLAPSKGEARRLIQQGGITVDDQKIEEVTALITASDFEKGHVILRKGKKVYHKALLGS